MTSGAPGVVSTWTAGIIGRGLADPTEPLIHIDDLGLQRGDGCFETVLVRRADQQGDAPSPVHLDGHLTRLARSAAALDLPPPDEVAWRAMIDEVLAAGSERLTDEAVLKLLLTRGVGGSPTALVTLGPVPPAIVAQRATGLAVVTLSVGTAAGIHAEAPWLLGGVKTLSYAVNMAALREAARRGADDAVLVTAEGTVLEAPTATVLWWDDERLLTTPVEGTGILPGITQRAVFDRAEAEGVTTAYGSVTADVLATAEAVWLASSVRGVTPVHTLDGHPVPSRPDLTARFSRAALGG